MINMGYRGSGMVIDTSAVLAILFGEPEASEFADVIAADPVRLMSASTALEASIVINVRKGEAGSRELDLMLYRVGIEIVPFNKEQAEIAYQAWKKYGKGNHPASLNFGDCFAYALAQHAGEPLL
jgi:ribonuclease VapC